ncbi:integrase [Paraburkholderia hospita]|uniref:integrase n=1 Tax=Paraburkholderia hospita TaxID=169430 RepID=UPI000B34A116|nr:integrase [Paraburkholderia hospita]OUL89397.1 integrase [Paraburkholderia hospita]
MSTSLNKALAAARQRGRDRAIAVFNQPDNLRLEDAAAYAHIEPAIIDAARERGEVYALVSPTRPRELRYPCWQFDAPAGRLAAALRPFVHARKNCFVIHHFMLHVQTTASGPTSMQIILDTNPNIDALIQLAIGYMHADQGAS